jgi:hypothetical protein
MHMSTFSDAANELIALYFLGVGSRDSSVGIATGWTTEGSEFESWWVQDFSPLHVVQISSGAHPTSYPMGTTSSFPGGKAVGP